MLRRSMVAVSIFCLILPTVSYSKNNERIRESTIIYKVKESATPQQLKRLNSLVNKNNIITKRTLKGIGIDVVRLKNIKGFENAFSQQLIESGAVKFALPDASVPHHLTTNDLYYSSQWHHATINSPGAWDVVVGNPGTVQVCVLDTGVDTDHPDLMNNLLEGYNTASRLSDGATPNPEYHTNYVEAVLGHGTGTAGTVAAVSNNVIGVAGVAWDIGIIPVKINYDDIDSYAYYSDMIDGIQWCADQGVKVANLSYGGAHRSDIGEAAQYLRDRGGLLFMSAGNEGSYHDTGEFPDYTSFVAVGATDQDDNLTTFSEYGPYVDIVAPGQSIFTTYLDGTYIYYTGTSFSSPIAAGIASLLFSLNSSYTPSEVESFIFSTATDLGVQGDDDQFGHGLVNSGAAINAAYNPTPNDPPIAIAVATTETSGTAPLTVGFDGSASTDDSGITTYMWSFGDWNQGSGQTVSHTYPDAGTYSAILTVTDDRGETDTSTPITIQVDPSPYTLAPPANLSASIAGNDVVLTWDDTSTDEQGFYIQRATKITGKYKFIYIGTADVEASSYVDEDVAAGSYKYRVNSFYDNIVGDYSNEAYIKVETVTLPPNPDPEPDPSTLVAPTLSVSIVDNTANLSWTDECPAGSDCTYYIEKGDTKVRGVIDFSPFVDGVGLSYSDPELQSGTYYYKVYVTTNDTQSDDSNTVSARIK